MIARRLPVVVVLVALVAAALTLDPRRPEPATTSTAVAAAALSPLATAVDAGSSTWFCAGGSATVTGVAEHVITIANPTDAAAEGTLQLFLEGQDPQSFPVAVAALDQTRVPLAGLAQGEWAAALVELDRGGLVVSHEVLGIGGWDSDRCSSQASDRWYLPWGQTAPQEASSLRLALFNPFAVEAVVDIAFDTDDGFRTPEALQGFLVPPRRLVTVDVTNIVPVRLRVSTEVVARSGRLVVSRLQSLSGIDGTVTLDVTPAAPSGATSWYFADGRVDADTLERIAVYNPGEQTAQVEVEVTRARLTRDLAIEPFELQIPPQSYAEVVLNDESRVPKPLRHTTVVRSLNDVPVVAERVQLSSTVKQATATAIEEAAQSATSTTAAGDAGAATTAVATAPGDQGATEQGDAEQAAAEAAAAGLVPLPPGLSATLGTPVVARSWVLPDAGRPDVAAAKIVVTNVSNDQPATFSVRLYRGGSPLPTTPTTTAPPEVPVTEAPTTAPPTTDTTAPPPTVPPAGTEVPATPAAPEQAVTTTVPTTTPTTTPTTAPTSAAAPATTAASTTAGTSIAPAPADDQPAPIALEPRQ
ncbi:MAG: DUF5719 family protein, partial [Acidimicrobiia bacterium]